METLASLAVRYFGGKIAALVNAAIVMAAVHGVAYVASLSPSIAATIDPQAVAGTLDAVLFASINAITNQRHGAIIDALKAEAALLKTK